MDDSEYQEIFLLLGSDWPRIELAAAVAMKCVHVYTFSSDNAHKLFLFYNYYFFF